MNKTKQTNKLFNIIEILLDNLFIKLTIYIGIAISILMFVKSITLLRTANYSIWPLNILIINFVGFLILPIIMGLNLNNDIYDIFEIKLKTKTEENINAISEILAFLIIALIIINWIRVF